MGTRSAAAGSSEGSLAGRMARIVSREGMGAGGGGKRGVTRANLLRKQLRTLPRKVARQDWEILFLAREMRAAATEVQRGVIREWLERSEGRKRRYLEKMESCRFAYRRMTGREPPSSPAPPRNEPSLRTTGEPAAQKMAGDVEGELAVDVDEDLEVEILAEALPPGRSGRLL